QLPEQLLRRDAASSAPRLGLVDLRHHGDPHLVGTGGAEPCDGLVGGRRVLHLTPVERLPHGGAGPGAPPPGPDGSPPVGTGVAVDGDHLPAVARQGAREDSGGGRLAAAALAHDGDLHRVSSSQVTSRAASRTAPESGAKSTGASPRRSASARTSSYGT